MIAEVYDLAQLAAFGFQTGTNNRPQQFEQTAASKRQDALRVLLALLDGAYCTSTFNRKKFNGI